MASTFTGGCDCGAIRYECTEEPIMSGHCQCRDCQHFSGAGHLSLMMVPKAALTVTGEPKFYDKRADSGNVAHRGFCPNCGSPVIGRNSGMPDALFLFAGSLDDPGRFKPSVVVYTDRGHAWDHLDPTLTSFARMPPLRP
jgi:hypothetical protein